MLNVPFKWQVLSLPVVLIVPIVGVIWLTHSYLTEISDQNETVKDWARATDQLTIALAASQQMIGLLDKISSTSGDAQDEARFDYVEQSLLLKSSLGAQSLEGKLGPETRQILSDTIKNTAYSDKLDNTNAILALHSFQGQINTIYGTLQGKKREIYLTSNKFIRRTSDKLATMLHTVLGATLLLGFIVAAWLLRNTRRQLNSITRTAIQLLDEPETGSTTHKAHDSDFGQVLDYFEQLKIKLREAAANQSVLEGTELERKRIAMDIHDQFLAEFTDLRRNIKSFKQNEDANRLLRQVDHTLERLTTELRDIIDDLHPSSLDMLGLEAAIRNYMKRKFSSDGMPEYFINIEPGIESVLSSVQLIHIYRIITESVNNIIRHAHSTRFEITLRNTDTGILLTIEDNGIGFDLKTAAGKGGHGLVNIHQRSKAINSIMSWQASRFSQGACLKLQIPFRYLANNAKQPLSA